MDRTLRNYVQSREAHGFYINSLLACDSSSSMCIRDRGHACEAWLDFRNAADLSMRLDKSHQPQKRRAVDYTACSQYGCLRDMEDHDRDVVTEILSSVSKLDEANRKVVTSRDGWNRLLPLMTSYITLSSCFR